MKVEVTSPKPPFQPVTISLTIESQDELLSLWHRTNIAMSQVDTERSIVQYPRGPGTVRELWEVLDRIARERGLRE